MFIENFIQVVTVSETKTCLYCWPTLARSHFSSHLEYYLDRYLNINRLVGLLPGYSLINQALLWGILMEILAWMRVVRFEVKVDKSKLFNRSLIFFEEGLKRGLNIRAVTVFGRYLDEFKLNYRGRKYYYEGIPLVSNYQATTIDDKQQLKVLLEKHKLPIAPGKLFVNVFEAMDFGLSLGFPLIVKPNSGSLSHHVSYPINSVGELRQAIRIAKLYRPDFIVERFIAGNFYRASVIGREKVFVCQKIPANVVGNGVDTIKKLIAEKNRQRFRGKTGQKNTTLHQIPIDGVLRGNLAKLGLGFNSVLRKNRTVYLQDKLLLSLGCDIVNLTTDTPIENKQLFLRVAELLKSDLVGIDFICPDITRSFKSQVCAIIETNSLPYLDMHQYPSVGRGDDVAGAVWDSFLSSH